MQELPEKYLSLPVEKKVGQMFVIGLPGEQLDESTYGLLSVLSPSGVCLFARNTREAVRTRMLLDSVRDALLFEPILCLDQEGGLVDRLRRIIEPMPSAKEAGASGVGSVRRLAKITAEALRILGFNMNLAPVVDVITPERERFNNGLHARAFSSEPESVAELAAAYLDELASAGIVGCAKHFPGIGAAEVDSHDELPEVGIDEHELHSVDLLPYRELMNRKLVKAIMTGHAAFPKAGFQRTDEAGGILPTSLNKEVVTGLLRDNLGFSGASLTDDLEMGAVVRNYGIGEACVLAVEAGHDLLLICNSLESVEIGFRAMMQAVMNGRISEQRLNVSLERLMNLRAELEQPFEFSLERLGELSEEVRGLKLGLGG